MTSYEDSDLHKLLVSASSPVSAIKEAVDKTVLSLRSQHGQTFIHEAARRLISAVENEAVVKEIWDKLLSKCDMFARDEDSVSGLDRMVEHMDTSLLNAVLKKLIYNAVTSGKWEEFAERSLLSGKSALMHQVALSSNTAPNILDVSKWEKLEADLQDVHKDIRSRTISQEIMSKMKSRSHAVAKDLCGFPALHVAVIHGHIQMVKDLTINFPEAINVTDKFGRTAIFYAVSFPGSEEVVNILSAASCDRTVVDIYGHDALYYETNPIDHAVFMKAYNSSLERNSAQDRLYRAHGAVLTGKLRTVKMALERREHAIALDGSQLTALHKSLILDNKEISQWIGTNFPASLNVKGKHGFTPMHLAAVADKTLFSKFKDAGGDDSISDAFGNSPKHYLGNPVDFPVDLQSLKLELKVTPASRPVSVQQKKSAKSIRTSQVTGLNPSSKASLFKPIKITRGKSVAPPETLDAQYIARALGGLLTTALTEIAQKRPWDPIEYLAQWLYKHKLNQDFQNKKNVAAHSAKDEEAKKKQEAESRMKRRKEALAFREKEEQELRRGQEEERKKRELEEMQRKAKESVHLAQPPELATVAEVNEEHEAPPSSLTTKDENGLTQLHRLITSLANGSEESPEAIQTLLASGIPLSERNGEGHTARDVAEQLGLAECISALDEFAFNLFMKDDKEAVIKLLVDGYCTESFIAEISSKVASLPTASKEILDSASKFNEAAKTIHQCAREGDLAGLLAASNSLSDDFKLPYAKCQHGGSSLHTAVLFGQLDVVKALLTEYPTLINGHDNLNRSPLHYAYGLEVEQASDIRDALLANKAEINSLDCKQRKPDDFQNLHAELQVLRESFSVGEAVNSEVIEAEE